MLSISMEMIKEVVSEMIDEVVEAGIGGEGRKEVSKLVSCV